MKKSAILALLLVLLLAFSACGDKASDKKEEEKEANASNASDILTAYNKAYMDQDAEKVYSCIPQIILDYTESDKSEIIDEISEEIEYYSEEGVEREIKNIETQKVDKDIVDQWNTYLAEYSEYEDYYDEDKHKVTEAQIVTFDFVYQFDDETETESEEVVIVKENGEWKLLYSDIWSVEYDDFDWENGIDYDDYDYEDDYDYDYDYDYEDDYYYDY